MKALVYEGIKNVQVTQVQDPKLQNADDIIVKVTSTAILIACGHCWYCEHNLFSQCDNSNEHGENGAIFGYSDTYGGYDGGQAEYLRVPYANVGPKVIPEELSGMRCQSTSFLLYNKLFPIQLV